MTPAGEPRPLDAAECHDAVAYLRRLVALQADAAVRLRGRGDVLGVFGRPPLGVVSVRTARTAVAWDGLDLTVTAAGLAASWADGGPLPTAAPPGAWPGLLPPVDGWRDHGAVPAAVVPAARSWAAEAFREGSTGLGPAPTPAALEELAERLWTREAALVGGVGVPLRLLHAADGLGFLPAGDAPGVRTAGPWLALVGRHGTVLLRRSGGLGPLLVP